MGRRWYSIAPASLVFLGLFVAPLVYFLAISFWSVKARMMRPDLTAANYISTLTEYGDVLFSTLAIAGAIALVTTLLAFGFAYVIRFKAGPLGPLLLFVTLITLFGGYLVKIYAWKSILGIDGILNMALTGTGLLSEPSGAFIYSTNAVVITLTYFLLPFAVLPIYGALRSLEDSTLEAARDLGAHPLAVMRDIVVPQCEGGVLVAFTLAFLISAGDYVTPQFVGGGAAMMGRFIESEFSTHFDWPMGSAMSFTVLANSLLVVLAVRALFRWAFRR
jgi:spermidine/putrescine transport system permease protein